MQGLVHAPFVILQGTVLVVKAAWQDFPHDEDGSLQDDKSDTHETELL